MEYSPREIERKWSKFWEETKLYKVENESDKPKYYVLDMFPYPSGSGLHVGHPLGYIASDIYSRYKRLEGYNVLHPMGFDAFGLPAEQYAIETGTHPAVSTENNIKMYRSQLDNLGLSFDWSRQVITSDPKYYKWTQWIVRELFEHYYDIDENKAMSISHLVNKFEQSGSKDVNAACSDEITFTANEWRGFSAKEKSDILMNYRLAYRKIGYVNWCEELGTVLANDEVKDGVSERGGYPITKKELLQWSLRTTAYADRLLNGLEEVDWSDALKAQQRNWIGKSEGAQIFFQLEGHDEKIEVFTTRIDTIYGATFMVLAPEHDLISKITTDEQIKDINEYKEYVASRSDVERQSVVKKVTGVFTGAYAINPFTKEKIPVWIGEYVLKDYGTGAIMAVPSDDERDNAFAEKYNIPIIEVVDKRDYPNSSVHDKVGKMINSGEINGMEVKDAIEFMFKKVEELGVGKKRINFRLRDANLSRQRYWGEPFPIVYSEDGAASTVEDLPIILPDINDYQPTSEGRSPLDKLEQWVNTPEGRRESDTMPGFAGSSWYFYRYMDPDNEDSFASEKAINYWKEVDFYIGGAEHAVGHLIYSRMWNKFLFDIGKVVSDEPFKKLVNQGMIQGVSEKIFLVKTKAKRVWYKTDDDNWGLLTLDGEATSIFVSADIIKEYPEAVLSSEDKPYSGLYVLIDYVEDYGLSEPSYMDIKSINRFIEKSQVYKNAVFVAKGGYYKNGEYFEFNNSFDNKVYTQSEIEKMSKSKYNVINPDAVIEEYGADTLRLYEMFLGPIEQSKPWDTKGIDGVSKFLRRFWNLFFLEDQLYLSDSEPTKEEFKVLHKTIKVVRRDIERLSYNTAISHIMVAVTELRKINTHNREILTSMVVLLAPLAPFITEELWFLLGNEGSVHTAKYPTFEEKYVKEDSKEYPICINGKKRATASFSVDASKEEIERISLEMEEITRWIEGKTVRKVIIVPNRMVNIVIG